LTTRFIEFNRSNINFKSFVKRIWSFDTRDNDRLLITIKRSFNIPRSSWIRIKRWSFVRFIFSFISLSSTGSNECVKDSRWSNWELISNNSCFESEFVYLKFIKKKIDKWNSFTFISRCWQWGFVDKNWNLSFNDWRRCSIRIHSVELSFNSSAKLFVDVKRLWNSSKHIFYNDLFRLNYLT